MVAERCTDRGRRSHPGALREPGVRPFGPLSGKRDAGSFFSVGAGAVVVSLALGGLGGCGASSVQRGTPRPPPNQDQPRERGKVAWPQVSGELAGGGGEKDGAGDAAVIVAIFAPLSISRYARTAKN